MRITYICSALLLAITTVDAAQNAINKKTPPTIPAMTATAMLPINKWLTLDLDEQKIEQQYRMEGHQEENNFIITQNGISQIMAFRPEIIDSSASIAAIIATHGTFNPRSPRFNDPDDKYFLGIRNFAEQMALHKKTAVFIVSYAWQALDDILNRLAAGWRLATIINTYFSSKKFDITLISHSHGCNVANVASQYIRREIELMIHYTPPILERESPFNPTNFKKLVSFYSSHDVVQLLGTLSTLGNVLQIFNTVFLGKSVARKYTISGKSGEVYNIETLVDGEFPSHTSVIILSWFMPAILERLKMYEYNRNLIVNIDTQGKGGGSIMLAINNPIRINRSMSADEKKTLAYETEFSNSEAAKFETLYHKKITAHASLRQKLRDMREEWRSSRMLDRPGRESYLSELTPACHNQTRMNTAAFSCCKLQFK